jgi:hypothetical protein
VTEDLRTSATAQRRRLPHTMEHAVGTPTVVPPTSSPGRRPVRQHGGGRDRHRHHRPPEFQSRIRAMTSFDPRTRTTATTDSDPSDPATGRPSTNAAMASRPIRQAGTATGRLRSSAAAGNNWSGMAGVNWKTRILPVRVLGMRRQRMTHHRWHAVGRWPEVPGVPPTPTCPGAQPEPGAGAPAVHHWPMKKPQPGAGHRRTGGGRRRQRR